MKWFLSSYIRFVERYVPSPFLIALLLSAITFLLAVLFSNTSETIPARIIDTLIFWKTGFWELLAFSMQMVLILLLGHTLALSPVASRFIKRVVQIPKDAAQASYFISIVTLILCFLNWGLCLIVGAILSRKMAERFQYEKLPFHYGLFAAAGYVGMMAWHGGFSGSAPLKVAESNHFLFSKTGTIPISNTVLSEMNLTVIVIMLLVIPLVFYGLAKIFKTDGQDSHQLSTYSTNKITNDDTNGLEGKSWLANLLGLVIFSSAIAYSYKQFINQEAIIDLNFINFILFGSSVLAHKNLTAFLGAVQHSISGISGIIIQFPLYAGIMGIMKYSGLIVMVSDFFVSISTETTFPIITFLSAGLVNFFVPSGGGQWAVQGPIIIQAADALNISHEKIIMALAYGDGLTNMLQPFWALPLLGITNLKAKEILPFSFFALLAGSIIYILALLLF